MGRRSMVWTVVKGVLRNEKLGFLVFLQIDYFFRFMQCMWKKIAMIVLLIVSKRFTAFNSNILIFSNWTFFLLKIFRYHRTFANKNWLSVYVIHSIANVDFWIVMTESDHDINHCVDCSAQSEENLINAGKWRSSLSSSPSDGSSTNNSEQRLTIGPSMSFYPDFSSIYPDFIQILSSRNQDKIKIRSR